MPDPIIIVHDYHTNNKDILGRNTKRIHIDLPVLMKSGLFRYGAKILFYATDSGPVCVMLTDNMWSIEERAAFIKQLHANLKVNGFSQGIDAVQCADSNCTSSKDFGHLFGSVKQIDPSIQTFEVIFSDKKPTADCSFSYDVRSDEYFNQIASLLGSGPRDAAAQPDWADILPRIDAAYKETLKSVNAMRGGENAVKR